MPYTVVIYISLATSRTEQGDANVRQLCVQGENTHTHLLPSFTHSRCAHPSQCRLCRQEASAPLSPCVPSSLWPGDPAVHNQLTVIECAHKTNNRSCEQERLGDTAVISPLQIQNLAGQLLANVTLPEILLSLGRIPWSLFFVVFDYTRPLKGFPTHYFYCSDMMWETEFMTFGGILS